MPNLMHGAGVFGLCLNVFHDEALFFQNLKNL